MSARVGESLADDGGRFSWSDRAIWKRLKKVRDAIDQQRAQLPKFLGTHLQRCHAGYQATVILHIHLQQRILSNLRQ